MSDEENIDRQENRVTSLMDLMEGLESRDLRVAAVTAGITGLADIVTAMERIATAYETQAKVAVEQLEISRRALAVQEVLAGTSSDLDKLLSRQLADNPKTPGSRGPSRGRGKGKR